MSTNVVAEEASQGATSSSTFIPVQLPSLSYSRCPHVKFNPIRVLDGDSLTIAREMAHEFSSNPTNSTARRVAVLNLASDQLPGGGWPMTISTTQEEALCYSSTLYPTLIPDYYPWPNTGPGSIAGIYSPGVVIFRQGLESVCDFLLKTNRVVVAVLTVVAPRDPELSEDGRAFEHASVLYDLREKIRLAYRMAASNGHTDMVLGAMGCGAYGCPREAVAHEMQAILLENEFLGWFENVLFAVYGKGRGGIENFEVFRETFKGGE